MSPKTVDHTFGDPQDALKNQGYFDSRCSRYMIGNISYLTDFKEHDEGYVAFGGGAKCGKITGKGTIRTGILNIKMMGDVSDQKIPIPGLTITHASNQEKSLDLLSHRGLEIFKLSSACPMMIHGMNIPILDVSLFYFYTLISSSMGELGQAK
nr:hypothetical protein [Tanacetum cinerariifolium]